MRKGPPPGMGWYGPYHEVLWVVPSQFYPDYPPQRVTCVQFAPITGVAEQWEPWFENISLDGVPSADRKSIVYDFPQVDLGGARYSSCRLTADPGLIGGYYSQQWEFVYGLSTLILSYNNKWGPFTTDPQYMPVRLNGDELGNGLETVHGIIIGKANVLIRPAGWNLYN